MWHIELVKNKYKSLEDLYSLLQYVFRLNKTADDSRRANIITDDLTGCLPAMIPDMNNPDMVYQLMLFTIQRRHKDTPQLVRHRIVSFQASDCILPQDLIPLAQSIANFYAAKGLITAYGIHTDTYCVHIHFVICTVSFTTLNLFYSGYVVELKELEKIIREWMFQFEEKLQGNPRLQQEREAALYGDDCIKYGNAPLTAKEQIKQNRRIKIK